MEESFVDLLKLLTNDAVPVAEIRLAELSDLNAAQMAMFADVWERLSSDRRRAMLEELGSAADAKIEFSFEAINHLGLADPDSAIRIQAIENLWESEDPGLVGKFLLRLKKDSAPEVRAAAGKALGVFILIGETRHLDSGLQNKCEDSLLRAAISDASEEVRDSCLRSMGYSSRPEVADLIQKAYAAGSDARRAAALCAMARSENVIWAENVLARLNDPSPQIRLEAVRAAGDLGLREGIPDLIELLEDVDESVWRAAVWSLSQIGGPRATKALNEMATDELDEAQKDLVIDAIDHLEFFQNTRDLFPLDRDDAQDLQA